METFSIWDADSCPLRFTIHDQVPDAGEHIAANLSVPERVPLFCVASNTDWVKAGVTPANAQAMVSHLIECNYTGSYRPTSQGHAVLAALLTSKE
jgi:hypothetical protein